MGLYARLTRRFTFLLYSVRPRPVHTSSLLRVTATCKHIGKRLNWNTAPFESSLALLLCPRFCVVWTTRAPFESENKAWDMGIIVTWTEHRLKPKLYHIVKVHTTPIARPLGKLQNTVLSRHPPVWLSVYLRRLERLRAHRFFGKTPPRLAYTAWQVKKNDSITFLSFCPRLGKNRL